MGKNPPPIVILVVIAVAALAGLLFSACADKKADKPPVSSVAAVTSTLPPKEDKFELAMTAELLAVCAFVDNNYGNQSLLETLTFKAFGPISSAKGAFGGTLDAALVQNPSKEDVEKVRFSGEISELKVGGKIKVDLSGTEHQDRLRVKRRIPVHAVVEGEIVRQWRDVGGFAEVFAAKATSIKIDPHTMYLGESNRGGKHQVWGDCKPHWDWKRQPLVKEPFPNWSGEELFVVRKLK